jgi:hypothetical protein
MPKLLQHDNAITHTSDATSAVIESIDFEYVSQPHYSLELVSSDFWLFAALLQLKGIHLICNEVPAATRMWFQEVPEEFYSNLLENLVFASVALY